MRRKLLLPIAAFLSLLAVLPGNAEEQPPYESKDPVIAENFRRIYYSLDNLSLVVPTQSVVSSSYSVSGTTQFTGMTNDGTAALSLWAAGSNVFEVAATQVTLNTQTNINYSAPAGDAYIQVNNTAPSNDGASAFTAYNGSGATAMASFGASYSGTRFGHAAAAIGELRCNTANGLGIGTSIAAPVWIGTSDDTAITISTNNDVTLKTGRSFTASTVTATNVTLTSATVSTTLIVGTITVTGGSAIRGTSSNDDALAGNYGEYISSSVIVATNYPNSGIFGDLAAVVLTPGAWLLSCNITASGNITGTEFAFGISSVSGNTAPAPVTMKVYHVAPSNTANAGGSLANVRFQVTVQTTVYLKYFGTYTVGRPQAQGELRAVRFH